ncbi:MAG: acyl-CoA dehydrogenase family protein [Acidobacteria bacterium]|nr:acyl-CoA dehydrogenase family protein [Acidobacteriota bacterium]
MRLTFTDEQQQFQRVAAEFAASRLAPLAASIDETGLFPRDLLAPLGALGLLGVTVPRAWGGAGRDYVAYALALEALARESAVVAVIASVNNSLVAEPLAQFGTDAQKHAWLERLATGRALGAFALSEEHAGTDAANQQTRATFDGTGHRISGRKVWVANAEAADVVIVFAATQPDLEHRGITAFLVPLDTPGITTRVRADSLGVRGLGCLDLEFDDVHVDSSQVLGAPGAGFAVARWALDGGRVAIAAQALGVGQAALDEAVAHARHRVAFGQAISNYQAIQWMLADVATDLDAARMLTWKAAAAKDTQERCSLEASMAKLAASEAAHRAADRAMQVLASAGYRRGSKVERLFRDVRATEIYQGTSEVQRMIIAANILAG